MESQIKFEFDRISTGKILKGLGHAMFPSIATGTLAFLLTVDWGVGVSGIVITYILQTLANIVKEYVAGK